MVKNTGKEYTLINLKMFIRDGGHSGKKMDMGHMFIALPDKEYNHLLIIYLA
jgi:hypothetical protein